MPTYEYRCANGHEFERFQRMSEPPVDTCPTCGAPAQRLLSAGGLLFKGSGFYITDYRADSYRKAAAAESGGGPPADGTGSKSVSPSDSKGSSGAGGSPAPKGE